jgi:hypothetical protein
MARTGRPRVPGVMAHIRIPPAIDEKIEKYVEEHNKGPAKVTKNSVVIYALEKFFAELEAEQEGNEEGEKAP